MFRPQWPLRLHFWPAVAWICSRRMSLALRHFLPPAVRPAAFRLPPNGPALCSALYCSLRRLRCGSECRTDNPRQRDRCFPGPASYRPHPRPRTLIHRSPRLRCSAKQLPWHFSWRFRFHVGGSMTTRCRKAYDDAARNSWEKCLC